MWYVHVQEYCMNESESIVKQSGRISLLARWKCFFKKRLCIVRNYGRVKSIIAAPLLLFIYNEATRSITWHKIINKFLQEILECLLVWRDFKLFYFPFAIKSLCFHSA